MSVWEYILSKLAPVLWSLQNLRWRLFQPTTLGVKLLLIREGHVLLVRQTYLPGWHLPGGGVKHHEEILHAIRREAREEVGATMNDVRLFGAYTEPPFGRSGYVLVFVARDFVLRPSRNWEIADIGSFPLGSLPADTDPATKRRVEEFIADGGPVVGRW